MPALVGMVHRLGHFRDEFRRGPGVLGEPFESLVECIAFDQLHAEIALVLVMAHLVDRHDPRVVEQRDGLGLVLESAELVLARELRVADQLQGDAPIQTDLPGLVDDPHPPLTENLEQFVIAEVPHP